VTLSRRALVVGDSAVEVDGETFGVVERKRLEELAVNVVDGSLPRLLAAPVRRTCGDLGCERRGSPGAKVVARRWYRGGTIVAWT
jgi:hypothetical protein